MAKVTVTGLNKIYENGFHAVKGVDFVAEDKEFVVLVGPSGCGKTTTLRLIAGLEDITTGTISIGERVVNDVLPKDRDIAMVFQNYALYPHMTVFNNMAFALKLRKRSKEEIKEKVDYAASLLGIDGLLDRKPKQLSGGQRQRVALGRAIVRNPQVFLFDEPLSNLDAKLRVQMRAEIGKLHKQLATTMIYVTHDQVEAMTMADKIVVMKDGLIHQIDSPLNVYNHPANLFVAGFIGSPSINIFKGSLEVSGSDYFFKSDKFKVQLTAGQVAKVKHLANKAIIMGLRPEDIYDAEFDSMAATPQRINAVCDLVEPMGNEFTVFFVVGKDKFTARFDPKKFPTLNAEMTVSFDMEKAHFFDEETEECLY
jgi:multiple sugar transport system ATP-binding protein